MKNASAKKGPRFNLLDLILILILLAALGTLFWLFFADGVLASQKNDDRVQIEYVIESKKIREEYRGLVSVGDTIVDTVGHYPLGEVINVQYAEATYTGLDQSSGEMVTSPYPGHLKVTITVRAEAVKSDMSYSIGGYRMSVGGEVFYRVPHFTFSGYCTGLEEKPAASS